MEWHFFHKRVRTPFFHEILLTQTSVRDTRHPFDNRWKFFGSFCDHVVGGRAEKDKLARRMRIYTERHPAFLLSCMRAVSALHRRKLSTWQKATRRSYRGASALELADAMTEYVADLVEFRLSITHPLFLEEYFERELSTQFVVLFGHDEGRRWYEVAVTPVREGSVKREERALLRIAASGRAKEADIARHAHAFSFMANVRFDNTWYDAEYYRDRLARISVRQARERLAAHDRTAREHEKNFSTLVSLLSRAGQRRLVWIAKTANQAVFFRSYRTEIYYSSMRFFMPLFDEVAQRLGLSSCNDVLYLYWDEVDAALRNKEHAPHALIPLRKRGYAFLSLLNGHYVAWDGDEAHRVLAAFQSSVKREVSASGVVRGVVAYPGNARGRVRVVQTLADCKKIRKGDIVVAHATNINMVPFLKKARAIVTEEGGILSHASIISRELRIPCIIGTKTATAVFRDGDKVEVDATGGSARKVCSQTKG